MKIVVLDGKTLNGGDVAWSPITELGQVELFDQTEPDQLLERASGADVVVTNKVVLDSDTIANLPHLKFITVTATGYNVVDIDAARNAGIPVSNVPVYGTQAVAQHVFAMLLAFIHRPEAHHQAVRNGDWINCKDFCFWLSPIVELQHKKMGIVGFGRIGQATARLAHAFGMELFVHNRTQRRVDGLEDIQWMDLESLFEEADVISLHWPQTEANVGFVNRSLIGRMKENAILINTARGGLVNEQDLAAALNEGRIGGACLDVVSVEPMSPDNPLRTAERCLITPHNAWAAREARQRLMEITRDNIVAFQSGQPIHVVNA